MAVNKSMTVAAPGLPIPKLMMVIPLAVAHCIGRSFPTTSTPFQEANKLT